MRIVRGLLLGSSRSSGSDWEFGAGEDAECGDSSSKVRLIVGNVSAVQYKVREAKRKWKCRLAGGGLSLFLRFSCEGWLH